MNVTFFIIGLSFLTFYVICSSQKEKNFNIKSKVPDRFVKRHVLLRTHHPHHYMIDPLPVHYPHHHHHHHHHHQDAAGFVVLGNQPQNLVGEGYSVLPGNVGPLSQHEQGYAVAADNDLVPERTGLQMTHERVQGHRHPTFNELFPVEEDYPLPQYGALDDQEMGNDADLTNLASHLDATHNYDFGQGLMHHHNSLYASHGFTNHGLDEEYGEGLLTPVDHDDPTGSIVDDMSRGRDIDHIQGHDTAHVQIKDHDGHGWGEWIGHPYRYSAQYHNGWGDGYYQRHPGILGGLHGVHFHGHHGHHWEPATHVISNHNDIEHGFRNEQFDDSFRFHYPTYEVPVHGNIVSEKEAKKIGLFDEQYLKKLGIWEEEKSTGQGNGENNWIGGMGEANNGCQLTADVGFLFDGTDKGSKKKEYFSKYIEFAKQVVQNHLPSPDGFHYGSVVYTDKGELQFDFDNSYDVNSVMAGLGRIKSSYPKAIETNPFMGDGLKVTKEQLFDATARDWVYQVLIILTDTKSRKDDLEKWAQALRDSTVNIYVIGFSHDDTKADKNQMDLVATQQHKDHSFEVDIDKLLGTEEKVEHPQVLARVIPNHVCKVNLIFVIDMKEKDSAKINAIKEFLKDSTSELALGQWDSHIAVIGYSGKAGREGWDLRSKWNRVEFLKAIDRLEEEAGSVPNAGKALETALQYYLKDKNIPREGMYWRYINVTVVISDDVLRGDYSGASKKLRDHGVIIHGVGWNKANEDLGKKSLEDAASDSDEFFVHVHKDIIKLKQVAKRMRQYFTHLTVGRLGANKRIEGGWEGHYSYITGDKASSSNFGSTSASSVASSTSSSSSSTSSGVRSVLLDENLSMQDENATVYHNNKSFHSSMPEGVVPISILNQSLTHGYNKTTVLRRKNNLMNNAGENFTNTNATNSTNGFDVSQSKLNEDNTSVRNRIPVVETNERKVTDTYAPNLYKYNRYQENVFKKHFVNHQRAERRVNKRKRFVELHSPDESTL